MNEYFIKSLFIISEVVIGIIIIRFVLDKIGIWMESKGWLYYKKKSTSGSFGNALLNIDAILNPKAIYVIEAKKKRKVGIVKREREKNKEGLIIEKLNKTTNERQFEFILPHNNINSKKNT